MPTNNIHFELAQLLRQFPLVDLLPWYPKSFLQSEADELLLGYFVSLADPVWIAEQLEQPLIDVQLQLSLIATRLATTKPNTMPCCQSCKPSTDFYAGH